MSQLPPLTVPTYTGEDYHLSPGHYAIGPQSFRFGAVPFAPARPKPPDTVQVHEPAIGSVTPAQTVQIPYAAQHVSNSNAASGGGNTHDPFGALPMETLPPAPSAEKPAQFTPAQYHAPKKGLEYLAAGLALLFPGAPISYAASGLATGLYQKSENDYQRDEQQAEQQYKVAQTQNDIEHQNALDAYQYGKDQAAAAFQDAQAQRQNRIDMAARGLDWRTGQPFKYPTLTQAGSKGDYASTMQAYQRLISVAQRNGDTANASLYAQQMQDYDAQQKALAKDMFDINKELMIQSREDARTQFTSSQSWARAVFTQQQENWRHDHPGSAASMKSIRSEQFKVYQSFTSPQVVKDNITGQFQVKPPLFSTGMLPSVQKAMTTIDRSTDPQGMAERLAAHTHNTQAQAFFMQYGMLASQGMQAAGIPIIPLTKTPGISDAAPPTPGLLSPSALNQYLNAVSSMPFNQAEQIIKSAQSLSPAQKNQIYTALKAKHNQGQQPAQSGFQATGIL